MTGAMIPKPTATKKDAKTITPTSRGNSAKGLVKPFLDLRSKLPSKNYCHFVDYCKATCDSGKFTP
jgi:hypothetical protein